MLKPVSKSVLMELTLPDKEEEHKVCNRRNKSNVVDAFALRPANDSFCAQLWQL